MQPPTSRLPPIKSLETQPLEHLEKAVRYLWGIYNPPVRGSRRRTAHKEKDASDDLRTDDFERSYSMKWLTALVSQCELEMDSEEHLNQSRKEILVEEAASLLAICAGTASAGVVTRRFTFDLADTSTQITVDLTDVPLDNQDYASVGAQTWGGACIMAEMMAEDPDTFFLPWSRQPAGRLRYLELGAGTGLVSLIASKILHSVESFKLEVDLVATDYYPSVLANLAHNLDSNLRASCKKHVRVSTQHLDWSTFCDSAPNSVFEDGFDVVYGADIVYESQHAIWIKSCLEKLLRKPTSSNPNPTFHLIIPLRATHSAESNTIEQVFPPDGKGLVIKHKEIIVCYADSGKSGEEIEYAYFRIGW
ncbi:Protein-lysine N-methyltransferase EFM2 [Psilocybe cubensis]|uniref:Protein-lysine N-methyltransferase EFM2 n=2 Tax=Psilocybe cubensis TaxID=181762 RepID=A0ACB8HI22_PSICU|nr:Protein-lysine N-methyltransferase EFM2 [Psilocybe cubensis]KAH9487409.1 Protein-lysine N-methyltransferase EFM2 [Psilocybe cubensis]